MVRMPFSAKCHLLALLFFYYVRAVSEPNTMPKAGTKKGDGGAPHGTETEKKSLEDGDEDEAVSLR